MYYTVKDVAERYKVNVATVYIWIKNGKLSALRLSGTAYRISEESLREFEEKCKK